MLLLRLLLSRVHVFSFVGMLTLSAVARGDAVLLRFYPPAGVVAGYKVYSALQTTGTITSAALDAGARAPDTTGVASYSLSGLDPTRAYSVEMTAYDSRGVESGRSNRVSIPSRTETLGSALWSSDFQMYAPGVHVPGFVDSRGDSQTTTGTDLFGVAYLGVTNATYGTESASGTVSSRYTAGTSAAWGSYEISGRVLTVGIFSLAGIAARVTNTDGSRYFELGQVSRGAWVLSGRNENALTCRSSTALGVTQLSLSWYNVRFRVTQAAGKTRLRAKVWLSSATEPSAWQADCWTTLSASADSGTFALRRDYTGAAYFDNVSVQPVIGTLEPIPPP
jgi:hypothetical protein